MSHARVQDGSPFFAYAILANDGATSLPEPVKPTKWQDEQDVSTNCRPASISPAAWAGAA
jgi:hypothetical protein